MSYLERWNRSLLSRSPGTLRAPVSVEGIREVHLGPKLEVARIEFIIEPSTSFEVLMEIKGAELRSEEEAFVESAVFGFLDVVLLEPYPFRNIRIRVVGAEFDAVSSSLNAFRRAGSDAGRSFLKKIGP